ncbi:hypothetical protein AO1008_09569 [Aspergillus oryzae 100-8]|nr:hypothetical protein AO1008_09569 [Aspergillus oryzae 100-8]
MSDFTTIVGLSVVAILASLLFTQRAKLDPREPPLVSSTIPLWETLSADFHHEYSQAKSLYHCISRLTPFRATESQHHVIQPALHSYGTAGRGYSKAWSAASPGGRTGRPGTCQENGGSNASCAPRR